MKPLTFRWLCVLSLSLPLLVWFGHVITRDGPPTPAEKGSTLRGYMRISPRGMDQFLDIHCNHCALVSSSGHLLGAGAGEEIDKTGCVLRMNNAPTLGFERDVGSRTTVRVVSHTSVPRLVKNESYYFGQSVNTTYVFWGPERNMRQDGKGLIYDALMKTAKRYPSTSMYAVTREKVESCDNVFENETGKNRIKTGTYLSTGFFTMILAIEMCDSIQVYGMIDDNFCRRAIHSPVPYHYYEKVWLDECKMYNFHEHRRRGGHRFITEKAIYAKWATQHKIEFKHPSWSP
ncbi:alpha-N-acetyl-neuraminyl-2,3-beta-galactosyl-1,3-N-acetyl-galactosaminide alpha-2,6-sialyltransferase [Notolabrus celidotus]|uniref:alpha-N-acetyl-neuraminyl-2,3-beta-galactosyl-1, 3-N-acetyl-galactosaminide alpha-2,6-sialyltransferase n=1 Tax=Notolabrus celidotus TaxID=1203425 RepID=UPI00148F4F33|nr:alpha-N-acetyl-neuraminyl-2,3-beta-galactosyl-1,3-N-acetyl-galactosaminide alpha-2,6-sialyltransferase [Notolabrus celidotus]